MKMLSIVGALVASFVSFCSQADVPMIRFASGVPYRDGKCVEAVWAKADVCTRFVEVNKNDVALDPSEARILFDERNLYVALKGSFDPQYDRGDVKKGMSSVNNFEFLLKPPADEYLHVIVDEFGRLYVAKGKTEARDAGVTANVAKGKGFWTANLTVPLKALGMSAPTADTTVKVGVFRWNINVHEREKLWANRGIASGFTPNKYNYGVPDLWADMTFTRTDGEARQVVGPSLGSRINLFPNPDFDVPARGWNAMGRTTYGETMAMSGEWIYRGSGKDYQILQGSTRWMRPSTRYTLVVKARSFGAGSALRIVEMARGKNGKVHEGVYATMLTPIGPEMHEYYLPFTSAADDPWTIVFYKVDNKADDTGLEIASIRLFEGEISSFEVRKLVRPGRMAIIPGTEKAVRPNPIGRFAKPPRTLTFIASKYLLREADEIFAGTGVKPDVLLLSGKDADVYSTYGDEKAISGRVAKGAYDLVMVPKRGALMIGKEMAKYVRAAVERGAGLYIEDQPQGLGRLADLVKDAKNGTLGKGRVVRMKTAGGARQYLPFAGDRATVASLFPADVGRMRLAAELLKLANGEAAAVSKTEATSLVYGGTAYAFERKLDAAGATVGWTETRTPVAGPTLGVFADDGRVSTVVVTGDVTGVTLAWEFRDFSGRVLAAAELPAAAKTSFVVPREKLYTNFGGIRLALKKDGKEVDVRGECVFVRDNDRKRLMDDYTPSMWPGDGDPDEMAQLEEIGIRSSILACSGGGRPAGTIAAGFGVGGCWLGDGSTFCGWAQKSNVRAQNFNTKQWRGERPIGVRKNVKGTYEYGLLDSALCDEPNLSRPGSADELDAHPENLAEYRVRMERKYGTIAEYNRRHETAHKSFADLNQALQADARAAKKYAEFIEWRNFNVDRWCEAIKLVSDSAREIDPDAPFTMCNSFGQSALSGNDYYKLMTRAGLGFSTEYTAMVYFGRSPITNFDEFIRSFRPDMRCWGWTGYFYSTPRARFMPWWTACHRYGGFAWYAATAPGYNIVDATTCALTVDGEELRQSLLDTRLLGGLGKVLTCWEWAPRDVAIYYSHDSMLLATILGTETKNGEINAKGPLHDHMHSRQGAQYTVEDLLYQHDFVAPEQVVGNAGEGRALSRPTRRSALPSSAFLDSYRALFLPRVLAMSDAEVAAVKAFLAKGGKAICDELPGGWDELGVKRAANPFADVAGITVLGRNFNDLDKDCRTAVKGFLEAAGATKALGCDDMVAHFGREAMHYVSGDADVYAVIRMPGRSEDDDALDFTFAKKGHAYDVRAQKYLGETDRVTAKTPLHEASVFAVLPAKVTGISVSGLPETVAAGADLSLDFLIGGGRDGARPSQASVPSYVLHVEVVPPSGKPRFHMKRNLLTQDGKAHLDFAMALNDEKGAWKLRVTEPLTGVTVEKPFEVR